MPRYDFQCKTCGAIFEQTRTFATATDPADCPTCGATANRLLRMPTLLRSGFSAPDPASVRDSSSDATGESEPQPLDPTKPHPAWEAMGSGCPCCPGGRHRPLRLPEAAPVD